MHISGSATGCYCNGTRNPVIKHNFEQISLAISIQDNTKEEAHGPHRSPELHWLI
jgi:hypothetical protein